MGLVKYNNQSISSISDVSVLDESMILIKTLTASADETLSFINGTDDVVFDSTYPIYVIKVINAHLDTDDRNLTMNFTTDGTNFNVTKTSTNFRATHDEGDTGGNTTFLYRPAADLAQDTGYQYVGESLLGSGSHTDASICAEIFIYNPSSTTFVKHYIYRSVGMTAGGYGGAEDVYVAGYCNTTSAITGVRFSTRGGGTITIDGTFKLYGIKDS